MQPRFKISASSATLAQLLLQCLPTELDEGKDAA